MHDMENITEQTVALQIRDFPVSLSRRMRARAALRGITTRDVVVAALEQYLPEDDKPEAITDGLHAVETGR